MRYEVDVTNGSVTTYEDAPASPASPLTVDDYKNAIVALLDDTARSRQYDTAVSITTYLGSTNTVWATEAAAFVAWRDAVWTYTYAELEKVILGLCPQPTVSNFLAELPGISWPTTA